MNELPESFNTLKDVLAIYIDDRVDHWTMQTYGGKYDFAPYVQALQEYDNMLLVEVTSNEFLRPPLNGDQQEAMSFLGWKFYPEKYLPNYAQFLDQAKHSPREIAELLLKTLHFVYGVDNEFTFEIAPTRADVVALLTERGDLL